MKIGLPTAMELQVLGLSSAAAKEASPGFLDFLQGALPGGFGPGGALPEDKSLEQSSSSLLRVLVHAALRPQEGLGGCAWQGFPWGNTERGIPLQGTPPGAEAPGLDPSSLAGKEGPFVEGAPRKGQETEKKQEGPEAWSADPGQLGELPEGILWAVTVPFQSQDAGQERPANLGGLSKSGPRGEEVTSQNSCIVGLLHEEGSSLAGGDPASELPQIPGKTCLENARMVQAQLVGPGSGNSSSQQACPLVPEPVEPREESGPKRLKAEQDSSFSKRESFPAWTSSLPKSLSERPGKFLEGLGQDTPEASEALDILTGERPQGDAGQTPPGLSREFSLQGLEARGIQQTQGATDSASPRVLLHWKVPDTGHSGSESGSGASVRLPGEAKGGPLDGDGNPSMGKGSNPNDQGFFGSPQEAPLATEKTGQVSWDSGALICKENTGTALNQTPPDSGAWTHLSGTSPEPSRDRGAQEPRAAFQFPGSRGEPHFIQARDLQVLHMQMEPPDLGVLRVRLKVHKEGLEALFLTQGAEQKAALEQGLHQLRHSLAEQGFLNQRLAVDVGGGGAHWMFQERTEPGLLWGPHSPQADKTGEMAPEGFPSRQEEGILHLRI